MDAAALDPRHINLEDFRTILEEGHLLQVGQVWARERYATEEDHGRAWHKRRVCIVAFRGAWRLSHMYIGYRWSGSVIFCFAFRWMGG